MVVVMVAPSLSPAMSASFYSSSPSQPGRTHHQSRSPNRIFALPPPPFFFAFVFIKSLEFFHHRSKRLLQRRRQKHTDDDFEMIDAWW